MPVPLVLATVTGGQHLRHLMPLWSVAPFGLLLLCIAVLPLVAGHFWDSNRNKALLCVGFGAPVKGNTMLNYFGIGPDVIECLVEKNELRRGLYSPGMHIPIVIESELKEQPDIYYVLAWNFKQEILANNRALIEKGVEFYFPVDPKVSA